MKTEKYNVTGMTCAACQANVTRCVQKLDGVDDVNVSLLANQMTVSYDETKVDSDTIIRQVKEIGYGASPLEQPQKRNPGGFRSEWNARQELAEDSRRSMKRRLISSVLLLIPLMYIAMGPMMSLPGSRHSGRHGKRPDISPGAAVADRPGHVYQPALFPQRL